MVFIKISVRISAAPGIFIRRREIFKYSVGEIWAAPVVVDILGGRVSGVL